MLKLQPDFVLLQLYINNFETPAMRRPSPTHLLPHDLDARLGRSSSCTRSSTIASRSSRSRSAFVDSYDGYLTRHLQNPESPDARESFGCCGNSSGTGAARPACRAAPCFSPRPMHGAVRLELSLRVSARPREGRLRGGARRCLDLLPLFASLRGPSDDMDQPDRRASERRRQTAARRAQFSLPSTAHGSDDGSTRWVRTGSR